MTLDSEVSQPDCIAICRSATLGTEACKPKCIAISLSVALGSEVSQLSIYM